MLFSSYLITLKFDFKNPPKKIKHFVATSKSLNSYIWNNLWLMYQYNINDKINLLRQFLQYYLSIFQKYIDW